MGSWGRRAGAGWSQGQSGHCGGYCGSAAGVAASDGGLGLVLRLLGRSGRTRQWGVGLKRENK